MKVTAKIIPLHVVLSVGDSSVRLTADETLAIAARLQGAALHVDRPYLYDVTVLEVDV